MVDLKKKALALGVSIVLAATSLLSGCSGKAEDVPPPESSAAETTSATTAAPAETETETTTSAPDAEPAAKKKEKKLDGSPFITAVEAGNIPYEKPALQDDLYTHYNFDFLYKYQDKEYKSSFDAYSDYVRKAVVGVIKDKSKTSHDLEQLRILFEQASDLDRLKELGISELMPYIEMIDSAESIEDLNEVLVSEDFPFSPFFMAEIGVLDTQGKNVVELYPKPLLFDPLLFGGEYYNDLENKSVKDTYDSFIFMEMLGLIPDFSLLGISSAETYDKVQELAKFETDYCKYLDYTSKYMKSEFGAYGDSVDDSILTAEEVWKLSPNIPLKKILDKLRMSGSELYVVSDPEWLSAFNDLWTDENLDMLKLMAKAKLFDETRAFRDPTPYNQSLLVYGLHTQTPDEFAYDACDSVHTFSYAISQLYVDECLGQKAVDRLTDLTQKLVDTYKRLVAETEWLEEDSRKALTEKLDNITLNVLEPVDGYIDFSDVELTPTEEGGTLFSNYMKLKQHRIDKLSEYVNKPATKSCLWLEISPTMDNAMYSPSDNSINICPGFVTGQMYTDDMDDSCLLSGLGFVIGHEISHGLDFSGSQFDAYGKPAVLFTEDDQRDFLEKTTQLADYYSNIELYRGLNVDGQVVVGEAAADLSGLQAVLEIAKETEGIDYDEFFKNLAAIWAEVMMSEYITMYAVDEHPFNHLRVNVNAQMLGTIYDVFGVKEGDGMYLAPEDRIIIWGKKDT